MAIITLLLYTAWNNGLVTLQYKIIDPATEKANLFDRYFI